MRALCSLLALLTVGCSTACPPTASNTLASVGSFLRGLVQAPSAAHAAVNLADAAGQPIPGLVHTQADANGEYGLYQLPGSYSYVVQASVQTSDGHTQTLETMATPGGDPTVNTSIDLATTLVTLAATSGLTGLPGQVDSATFNAAVEDVRKQLNGQNTLPAADGPLGYDRAAAEAAIAAMAQNDSGLADDLAKLKAQASTPKGTAGQLATDVAKTGDKDPLDALSPVY